MPHNGGGRPQYMYKVIYHGASYNDGTRPQVSLLALLLAPIGTIRTINLLYTTAIFLTQFLCQLILTP